MLIYSIFFLLFSNAINYTCEKSIIYSKKIICFLLLLLLLNFFLYFTFSYLLGSSSFLLHIGLALILLLHLIDYTNNFYYINKTRIGIKSYSRIDNILDVIIDIVLYLFTLILLVRSIITLIMSPVNSLLSAIFVKIKNIIISTFTSTPYYITLRSTYYKGGLSSLLNLLAILIYNITTNYVQHSLHYIIGFQCVCIYQANLGYDFWFIISLLHMIIHLPFFIISIGTYITIIDRNFYKKYPLLFILYGCACLFLFFVLIVLFIKFYGFIYDPFDGYFIQAKGDNGGNSGGRGTGSGPGSGPDSGPGPGGGDPGPSNIYPHTTNKKGKQKEENIGDEKTSHVNIAVSEYIRDADKIQDDKSLTVGERRQKLQELTEKRNKTSNKSSSSYSDEQALENSKNYLQKYKSVMHSGLTEKDKREKTWQ